MLPGPLFKQKAVKTDNRAFSVAPHFSLRFIGYFFLQGKLGNVVSRCTFPSQAKTKRKGNGHLATMTTVTVPSAVWLYLYFLSHCPVSGRLDL